MRVLPTLFLVFLAVPLLEVYLLIKVGQQIGASWTIGLVVATALIGGVLARYQGLVTLTRFYSQVQRGELPTQVLFDGACLLVAGALLLTPGFFTDAVGFALLTPPLRTLAFTYLRKHLHVQVGPYHRPESNSDTIEGRFRRTDRDEE